MPYCAAHCTAKSTGYTFAEGSSWHQGLCMWLVGCCVPQLVKAFGHVAGCRAAAAQGGRETAHRVHGNKAAAGSRGLCC